jgi:hypothetical protein
MGEPAFSVGRHDNGLTVFRDEIAGLLEHLDREGQEGARAFYIGLRSRWTMPRS